MERGMVWIVLLLLVIALADLLLWLVAALFANLWGRWFDQRDLALRGQPERRRRLHRIPPILRVALVILGLGMLVFSQARKANRRPAMGIGGMSQKQILEGAAEVLEKRGEEPSRAIETAADKLRRAAEHVKEGGGE